MGDGSAGLQGEVVAVTVTTPDEAVAEELSRLAVGERLAACAQVGGPIRSTYRWEGEVRTDDEWLLTIKTSRANLERLVDALRAAHPYEVPEIVAVPVVGGDPAYLEWVRDESM